MKKKKATYKTRARAFEEVDVTIIDEHETSIMQHYAKTLEHNQFLKMLRKKGIEYEITE